MNETKEYPILFSAPMVRAVLSGAKTQTRRLVKRPKDCPADYILTPSVIITPGITWWRNPEFDRVGRSHKCPFGKPGDTLWVRETHSAKHGIVEYRADRDSTNHEKPWSHIYDETTKWTPSIHMFRRHSRLTLKITDVRVERLNGISEADAIAEGIWSKWSPEMVGIPAGPTYYYGTPPNHGGGFDRAVECFGCLWESINGRGSWTANPWVWVVSFEVIPCA